MNVKTYLVVALLFVLVSSGFAATYYVGTCHTASYLTISAAVAAVPPNSTIDVCPGAYPEQVFITQPLTIQGIARGNSGRAKIVAPNVVGGVPAWQFVPDPAAGSAPIAPQIFVHSSTGTVKINNLTIDASAETAAPACFSSGYWLTTAIVYQDSSGTITEVNTMGQGKNSGCGVGIRSAVVTPPTSASVTISNSSIQDANETGMDVESIFAGTSLTINVSGNTLVVSGPIGIQYGGSTGTISSNSIEVSGTGIVDVNGYDVGPLTISNNTLHATSASSNGINVAGTVNPGRTVSGNKVVGFETGILLPNAFGLPPTAVTVKTNVIVNSQTGIDLECDSGATLGGNTIKNAAVGLNDVPPGLSLAGFSFYNVDQITGSLCP
jgi:hypothetical protein